MLALLVLCYPSQSCCAPAASELILSRWRGKKPSKGHARLFPMRVTCTCRCQALVSRGWGVFREKWGGLHPLGRARRLQTLASLQPLAEMQVVPLLLLLLLVFFSSSSFFFFLFLFFFLFHLSVQMYALLLYTCCEPLCAYAAASVRSPCAVHAGLGSSGVVALSSCLRASHRQHIEKHKA